MAPKGTRKRARQDEGLETSRKKSNAKKPAVTATKKTKVPSKQVLEHKIHITRSATKIAAINAVMDTTELLERVLLHLPPKEIYRVQAVDKRWKSVISNSPALQMRMFLKSTGAALAPSTDPKHSDVASYATPTLTSPLMPYFPANFPSFAPANFVGHLSLREDDDEGGGGIRPPSKAQNVK